MRIGITKDVTLDADCQINMICVGGTAGSIAYEVRNEYKGSPSATQTITITNAPAGTWIPVGGCVKVNTTGTTATGLIAF